MADLVDPSLFDEDYLYFYDEILTPERSDAETEAIVELGGLQPGMQVLDAPCGHGRLANRLAAHGLTVSGLDSSARTRPIAASSSTTSKEICAPSRGRAASTRS